MQTTRGLVLPLPLIFALLALPTMAGAQSGQAQTVRALEGLERDFKAARAEYLKLLGEYLPGAYREHLAGLSKDEMAMVAATRRLWQWYIDEGPFTMGDPRKQRTGIFREELLDPIDRVAEILLIDPAKIRDSKVRSTRSKVFKLGERLKRARERSNIEIDPTVDKQAPTGIPYPPLDRPHTCIDKLLLFERTLVLAKTVAHPDAEPILMQNAEACAEIDLKEADFAMYANQVRMLSGSIAWVVDPLMAACTRDFSNDRVIGKGSGHQSKIPGKRFPRDRARRFGCRVGPEGVGGGADGRQTIRGFAYNGTGHGGPLFAQLRNVVGPGCRQGAFTAVYTTDGRLRHACQATEGELVLPPGVTSQMIGSADTRAAFHALARGAFAKSHRTLDGKRPKAGFDRAIHRYLSARLKAEVDWTLTAIERIMAAGDVYEAHARLTEAKRSMDGIRSFDKRARRLEAHLSKRSVAQEIKIGRLYQKIIGQRKLDRDRLQQLIEKYPDSVYAAAAKHCLEAGKNAFWPELFYFVLRDTHLNKWSYLQKDRVGGR